MKLIKYTLLGLVLALICGEVDVLAQAIWLPKHISISVPSTGSYSTWSQCIGQPSATSKDTSGIIFLGLSSNDGGSFSHYKRTGDSISVDYDYSSNNGLCYIGKISISFLLDSLKNELTNFSISYEGPDSYRKGCIRSSIILSSLIILPSEDSILTGNFKGINCMNSVFSAKSDFSTFESCLDNQRDSHHGSDLSLDSLQKDTNSYECLITLVIPQPPVASVHEIISLQQNLNVFVSLINQSIHFSFPSSDHSQPLTIYDILGREVKRIEIAAGVTEYSLPKEQFMSGYYFARLGSQSASFIVN